MTFAWLKPEPEDKIVFALAAGSVGLVAITLTLFYEPPQACPAAVEVVKRFYVTPPDPLVGVSAWHWPMAERLSPCDSEPYRATACGREETEPPAVDEPVKAEAEARHGDPPERRHHFYRHHSRYHYRHR